MLLTICCDSVNETDAREKAKIIYSVDCAGHFSNRCGISKVVKVVHRNQSDNYFNQSDTLPYIYIYYCCTASTLFPSPSSACACTHTWHRVMHTHMHCVCQCCIFLFLELVKQNNRLIDQLLISGIFFILTGKMLEITINANPGYWFRYVRERERESLINKCFEQPDCGHLMDEVGVKLTLVTILYGST